MLKETTHYRTAKIGGTYMHDLLIRGGTIVDGTGKTTSYMSGQAVQENGRDTGARPGKIVRAA